MVISLNWETEKEYWSKGYKYIAGIDEAGRGALCGPVVTSAVIFDKPFQEAIYINDSKKLSPSQKIFAYKIIIKKALCISIGLANSQEIDKINIRNATHNAMLEAIKKLIIEPQIILIDGNSAPLITSPFRCIIKGDTKVISIAAASIIAKVFRDYLMIEYSKKYPNYGFDKNKGYATFSHINNIKKYGLTPWHRLSFKDAKFFINNLFY